MTVGDLAIVLHSHMPYVEGYGTYPFGEEWLFDAFARSHLPVLDVADRVTMTVTPVLADQLEADGVGDRMLAFLRRHRVDAADRDVADAGAALRPAAKAEADHYTDAMKRLTRLGRNPLRAFQEAHRKGRIALMPSAATHAVLPKLATVAGRRLQVDAGLARTSGASARRRGSGCRSAPTSPASRRCSPSAGSPSRAWIRARTSEGPRRCARSACPAAPSRSRSTGRPSVWSGPTRAIPPIAPISSTTGSPGMGCGSGRSPGPRTTPPLRRSGRVSTPRPSWPQCVIASSAIAPRAVAAA